MFTAGLACAPAAWEEHHRLALDGSGRSVILVSRELVPEDGTADAAERLRVALSGRGLTVTSTRAHRNGRVEAAVSFDSVAALCEAPLFRRACRYEPAGEGGFDFAMRIEPRRDSGPPRAETVQIRVRPEGRVTAHNSDRGLQRGNVLLWTRPLDRFLSDGLEVRVRTDRTSVFSATTRIVLRSALIALGIVGAGVALLLLEGRRRLRRERREGRSAASQP